MSKQERKEKYGRPLELNPNWKNGIYLEKTVCKCGNKKSYYAKVCGKCYDKTGKNNPFFGKKHNQQTKEKLSKASIGRKPINSLKIIINDVLNRHNCTISLNQNISFKIPRLYNYLLYNKYRKFDFSK